MRGPLEKRFDAKVVKGDIGECWLWTGAINSAGYGQMWADDRVKLATHISLELDGRPRPPGSHALHSCDNRPCVNPHHLRWGANDENMADKLNRGRQAKGETHSSRTRPDRVATGERHWAAKLTLGDVQRIRAGTYDRRSLARELGVHVGTITSIKTGKYWKRA